MTADSDEIYDTFHVENYLLHMSMSEFIDIFNSLL